RPDVLDIRGRGHAMLPLAIVSKCCRLDDGGRADTRHSVPELVERRGAAKGGRRKPTIGKKLLFARALLRSVKRRATRAHWRQRFDRFNGIDWDVLELECHDIDMPCERPKRVEILVIGDDLDIGYLAGWRIFLWRERMDAVSHPMRRN